MAAWAKWIEGGPARARLSEMLNPKGRFQLEEAIHFLMGLNFIPVETHPHNLCLTTPRASTFPRRDRARSQRTTLLMGGSIVARNAGRNDQRLSCCMAGTTG